MLKKNKVALEAMKWQGTPFKHQASMCRVGCDCIGLVAGVWRRLYGELPTQMPAYHQRWFENTDQDLLQNMADQYFEKAVMGSNIDGQLLLFKFKPDQKVRHLAIGVSADEFLHAYPNRGVFLTKMNRFWRAKLCGQYRWPNR